MRGDRASSLVRTLVAHRTLVAELVRRDVRARFAGARFGLLWSLINPAVQLTAYSLIFGYVYAAPGRPRAAVTASLFCGLWPWWAFQEGTLRGMGALVDQASLLRRIRMPAALPVLAATVASIAVQMLGFVLFLLVFSALGIIEPKVGWLALPALVGFLLFFTAACSLALAPCYLIVRDVMHVANLALTVAFFLSPVLYELEYLPESLRRIAMLNPLAAVLGLFRAVVLGAKWPSLLSLLALSGVTWMVWRLAARFVAQIEGRVDEYA